MSALIDPAEALRVLLDAVPPFEEEEIELSAAGQRVLVEPVAADRDFPPSDRSAMDGFAVCAAEAAPSGAVLKIVAELPAGKSASGVAIGQGEAARVFTGAVIPEGADAVVMVEQTTEDLERKTVRIDEAPRDGQHIRRRGEDARAGDEVLAAGTELGPAEIAALAAVGRGRVRVGRRPRIAVLSTGTEVVDVATIPEAHQVRNSNTPMLRAQLAAMGLLSIDLGTVEDTTGRLDDAIAMAASADLVLISGGVSVGDYDLVEQAMKRAGYDVLFHNVAMRPGKPILAARRNSSLAIGLPGNPLSAFTGFEVFVAPALRRWTGHRTPVLPLVRAALQEGVRAQPGRRTYRLARLTWRDGRPEAAPVRSASSGDVLSLARANAFICIPALGGAIEAGSDVDVMPFASAARRD